MSFTKIAATAVLLLCTAHAAGAQSLKLEFNNGRVTLAAQNMPLRAILSEWARLGGATIVNADGVAGPPVTLEVADLPERQALDILLRGVSGYMLGTRPVGSTGLSTFNRILILPTSNAPRAAAQPVNRPMGQPGGFQRPVQDAVEPAEPSPPDDGPDGPGPRDVPVIPRPFDQPEEPPADTTAPGNPFGVPFGTTSRPGVITPVPQNAPNQNARPDNDR